MKVVFKNDPNVIVLEPIPKSKPGGRHKKMDMQKAIKLLEAEYEKAQQLEYVRDPLAYALYQVWKMADGERRQP